MKVYKLQQLLLKYSADTELIVALWDKECFKALDTEARLLTDKEWNVTAQNFVMQYHDQMLGAEIRKALEAVIKHEDIVNEQFINNEISEIEILLNAETTEQLQKSKLSLQQLITEHTQKMIDYQNDPDKFDNKNKLKDIAKDIREKIIKGRLKKLEKEIEKFKKLIEKIDKKLLENHGN